MCSYFDFSLFHFVFTTGKCNANVRPELSPSNPDVIHSVGERHIVSCDANSTAVKWTDPSGRIVQNNPKERVHYEEREGKYVLMFKQIEQADNGSWTCQAERTKHKVTFQMLVYSK